MQMRKRWKWIPPHISHLLDARHGEVLAPIRSELFGCAHFEQYGMTLGGAHAVGRPRFGQATFYPRLENNLRSLRTSFRYIAGLHQEGHELGSGAEWLFDNFHLIEDQLREISEGLSIRYYRSLPVLQEAPLTGLPRIYQVAWSFVAHTDGAFDESLLTCFLDAYQSKSELSQGELWALPTTLRVILVENLRRLAERIACQAAAKEVATLAAGHIDRLDAAGFHEIHRLMQLRGVGQVFLSHLAQTLFGHRSVFSDGAYMQIEEWLRSAVPDLAALQVQQHADSAADHLSVGNAVASLRLVGAGDWPGIVGRTSLVVRALQASPVFLAEDDASRNTTLHGIERLAARSPDRSEAAVARALIRLMGQSQGAAQLAGYWLQGEGRAQLEDMFGARRPLSDRWYAILLLSRTVTYIGAVVAASLALVAWMLKLNGAGNAAAMQGPLGPLGPLDAWVGHAGLALLGLLMFFPASEAVLALVNRLICESATPAHLPRFLLKEGIGPSARTLVVIPALLSKPAAISELAHRLQLHYLANPEHCVHFALLSDWADADLQGTADDEPLLAQAREQIQALNLRYPAGEGQAQRFLLLHRPRSFSATQGLWMGWERKRGKLEQLVAALATEMPAPFLEMGGLSDLPAGVRYVLTLDSDTELPPGQVRALVGIAEHPHNQPELDATGRKVIRGYGILQPHVVAPLPQTRQTSAWQWLFSGQRGMDPYSAATSDVYQDLFGEGSFIGKGLLHVQALHAALSQRLPEDRILSHDLLEGSLARCAAISDVTVMESDPLHSDTAAARLHRWVRGDWQLLPVLWHGRYWQLAAIHRWKLFDNLRRSLVAPVSLLLIVLSMAGHGLALPLSLALAAAACITGPLIGAIAGALPHHARFVGSRFALQCARQLLQVALSGAWYLAQLLPQAMLHADAVARTLYRMAVSKRHLLEWTTAEASHAAIRPGWAPALSRHWHSTVLALALLAALWLLPAPLPAAAWLLLSAWVFTPALVWLCNAPWRAPFSHAGLQTTDRELLQDIARDTWRLFERCVGEGDNHLPPDNLQTAPFEVLAHRTSPTNIGLYLLSAACARQFGWIGTQDLLMRLEATSATLARMERHNGHFLNWYDTQSLQPLLPRYVSTVDSGNLGAHLLAVSRACLELARAPLDPAASQQAIHAARRRLKPCLAGAARLLQRPLQQTAIGQLLDSPLADPADISAQMMLQGLLRDAFAELHALDLPEPGAVADTPPGPQDPLPWLLADLLATLQSAALDVSAVGAGQQDAISLRLRTMAHTLEQLAWDADFRFLLDPRRQLLHIGYRLEEQQLDASFYDLLASESRTTSLLAIAKGDLPARHWKALGRPFFAHGRNAILRSWSGSMFEYLMPSLVAVEPAGSALYEANRCALREQMAFAKGLGIPWGMSESAYAARDQSLAYQYASQGVPCLALRRTPMAEKVIAPYATALACQVAAVPACANFRALAALAARGRYGFYEALDFSAARQIHGGRFTLVSTYMAHHQGMTIVALANVLLQGVAQRWGSDHPRIQAMSTLLQERTPRELAGLRPGALAAPFLHAQSRRPANAIRTVVPGARALEPTLLLSNGRYSVALRANGAGWSRLGNTHITRWRDDLLRDAHGSFVYLRTDRDSAPVSVTRSPAPDPQAAYTSTFHPDRMCFDARWPQWRVRTTVWISPEDDIELRKVVLNNLDNLPMDVELISAMEVVLAGAGADEAHPAFSSMFVKAHWLTQQQGMRFERVARHKEEKVVQMAHFVAGTQGEVLGLGYQSDRAKWAGRNHAASQPQACLEPAPGEVVALDTGLDPVAVLGVRMRVGPGGQVTVVFATAACDSASTLMAILDKYRQPSYVERTSVISATLAQGQDALQHRPRPEYLPALQLLGTALMFTLPKLQPGLHPHRAGAVRLPQIQDRRVLWQLGLSGDRPIIVVSAAAPQGLGLLRILGQALGEWSRAGVACDLVVLSSEFHSYYMPVQAELNAIGEQHEAAGNARPGLSTTGFHVLGQDTLTPAQAACLERLACVRLHADGRALLQQIHAWSEQFEAQASRRRTAHLPQKIPVQPSRGSAVPVSTGQFLGDHGQFQFDVSASRRPGRPWINVLANPGFGGQISESGAGNTWAINSRLNQVTAWSNDPVCDMPSEWFFLQNRRTRETWSVAPSAWGHAQARYSVVHGQGFTEIAHRHGDLGIRARWCVDIRTAVKQVRITVVNHGNSKMHLRMAGMVEWMLGERRADRATLETMALWAPAPDKRFLGLLCTQTEAAGGFGGGTAFFCESHAGEGTLAGKHDSLDWTCDRSEFFASDGHLQLPAQLGQRSGYGLEPCAALSRLATLRPGVTWEQTYLIGHATSPDAARQLLEQATVLAPQAREQANSDYWDGLLQATQIHTPDPLMDVLVNRWLPYQTVSSRLWSKAGFYQAGGATGYRDQLQDAMALVWADPGVLRQQITLCASRQFLEGDVQHWWHAPSGAGVRTRCSDDLLWLPFACSHYLQATGDMALLQQQVPFLEAPAIADGVDDVYETPGISEVSASVYEHAARAIDRSLAVGVHGLPLMGAGDWNDGMSAVGHQGRGESVWLAWFLCAIVTDWIPLARGCGDEARADAWQTALAGWRQALDVAGWDGRWYRRAFFDDGTVLGSARQPEARIDLIAQAWSVLVTTAGTSRPRIAMEAVDTELVQPDTGLIPLLAPPLVHGLPHAGYIQAYPAGVRENGGQYTHAGAWAVMAAASLALRQAAHATATGSERLQDTPYRYFTYLSPAHRASHPVWGSQYAIEPYAMAADVYTQPPFVGRGGWSWYTGSAAWMHRAAVESILGLHIHAGELFFTPCLPSHWPQAELVLKREGRSMRFLLIRGSADTLAARCAGEGAVMLKVSQRLRWTELAAHSCFVIPLREAAIGT